jgi:CheY-like chemotaxis protein
MEKRKRHLLLVEDDQDDIIFLRRAFRAVGSPVPLESVHDGDQAIAYLSGAGPFGDRIRYPQPTHVLLDLKLPRRSGLEVLEWMRRQPGSLGAMPAAILSSSGQTPDRERARILGADHYWTKPVSYEALQQVAAEIVAWISPAEGPERGRPPISG